ncbi:MAG: hypothetical protein KKF44_02715 [Nanoarchaeota archaeon]|nr:hypothetical protein [Nanoarchaeota archaeon]
MYLFSNSVGTFVFNQNMQIREKILFTEEESKKNTILIEKGETLETEKKFLEKFKNIDDLRQSKDGKKLHVILTEMQQYKNELLTLNMLNTKQKIQDSVTEDILVQQCVNAIDEYARAANLLVKRLREWYSFYFPEISKKIEDNDTFVKLILKNSKKEMMKEMKLVFSMGKDIPEKDRIGMMDLAKQVSSIYGSKEEAEIYLEKMMKDNYPNLTAIAGAQIGAKLISFAGSIKRLVMFPASTVQLLGAEKALFRHMVNRRCLPPKYGVIHEHPFIQKAPKSIHGKVARVLADKISLAVKIDYFKGEFRGDALRKEVEERIVEMNRQLVSAKDKKYKEEKKDYKKSDFHGKNKNRNR